MAAEDASPDLEALLAASYEAKISRECWAEKLEDGPFREYVKKLRDACAQGEKPVWARVQEIAEHHFGVRMTYETLRRHIQGACRCPK